MLDVKLENQAPLDLLDIPQPKLSSTDDMPVVETKPETAVPETEPLEESVPSEQPEVPAASDEPKKAKGVQKRIDELVTQREDNKRRAEAAEARLDRALQALERPKPVDKEPEKQEAEPKRPLRSEYQDPDLYDAAIEDYVEKRSSWIARREVNLTLTEERRKQAEEKQLETQRKVQESYRERLTKTREKYADFSEVAESPNVQVSMPMAHVILTYEQGPEIQYFLGKNPAEVARISSLSPELQLMELGMIAASLRTPAPVSRPVSQAPAPGKPIKLASEPEKNVEDLSMEEYAQKVREREAARRKPGGRLYS